MKQKNAFTMIELVFVIVVMGILGKFGTEFLAQAYKSFIAVQLNDRFQNQSATAIEFIAKRLQYRIKASTIVRDENNASDFKTLEGFQSSGYNVLEWIGYDGDGFRNGTWSGIFSYEQSNTLLVSPETNTTAMNTMISVLSNGGATIANGAIYFIGSESNLNSWGWDGVAFLDFNGSMKPIKASSTGTDKFESNIIGSDFSSVLPLLENNSYQFAWSAYAIVFDKPSGQLWFYKNYQPWKGEQYTDTISADRILIMEEVSDFKKTQIKGVIQIKVCSSNINLNNLDEGEYLTCKEKTIL